MKKLKYILIALVALLITGCGDVVIPEVNIDCTYYIWNNGKTGNTGGSNDGLTIYDQMMAKNMLDGDKIPKLHIKYTYDPAIKDVGSKEEGLKLIEQMLKVELTNINKEVLLEKKITESGFLLNLDMQQIKLNFSFADVKLTEQNYCPALYYDAYNTDGYFTNNFSTELMTGENLYISSDIPPNLPEGEKPNVPETKKPKFCKFNLTMEGLNDSITQKFHLYIRKQANINYEYAIEPVDDLNTPPDFNKTHSYQLITSNTTYINTNGSFGGVGNTNIQYDLSSIDQSIIVDEDGNLVCPNDVTLKSDDGMNAGGEVDYSKISIVSGDRFKKILSELQPYLIKYAQQYGKDRKFSTSDYATIKINGVDTAFPWVASSQIKDFNINDLDYLMRQKMNDVRQYCSDIYTNYNVYKSYDGINNRLEECIGFDNFYNQAASKGIFEDFSSDCPFITTDLRDKIVWFLDLMKIAAPIIALALGTFDFIKTIAAGDADKELKSTFKKFMIRIGSAILLFVIPIILAFILDLFLENQDGYNDPFCKIIDWNEVK